MKTEEVKLYLEQIKQSGIRNILALRGDYHPSMSSRIPYNIDPWYLSRCRLEYSQQWDESCCLPGSSDSWALRRLLLHRRGWLSRRTPGVHLTPSRYSLLERKSIATATSWCVGWGRSGFHSHSVLLWIWCLPTICRRMPLRGYSLPNHSWLHAHSSTSFFSLLCSVDLSFLQSCPFLL